MEGNEIEEEQKLERWDFTGLNGVDRWGHEYEAFDMVKRAGTVIRKPFAAIFSYSNKNSAEHACELIV